MGDKIKSEITPKTRVPLYVVGSAIGLAIYGTIGYENIMNRLDNTMTIHQAQKWIDDAREKNPSINWPRLPDKDLSAIPENLATTSK